MVTTMQDEPGITSIDKAKIYALYTIASCIIMIALNIIHTTYILNIPLSAASFVIPIIAGVSFAYLLAYIKVISKNLLQIAYTDSLTRIYNRLPLWAFSGSRNR